MSFDDLPPLPPLINPGAEEYAVRCMAATREVQRRRRAVLDCQYGDDYWQKLDVYLPDRADADGLPVLVFFHGGAWTNGTKEWMGFMAPPLLDLPAIFVAPNYRLAPAVRYPEILEDCLAATAWVRHNIARFGGSPDRLFVGGHSAGGHLAALVGLDRARRRTFGLPDGTLRGCLCISGSYDVRNREAAAGSAEQRIYDVLLARREDDSLASPITYVGRDSLPFLIAWGERDFPRLVAQAKAMIKTLQLAGIRVESLEISGADHFAANELAGDPNSKWCVLARKWLRAT